MAIGGGPIGGAPIGGRDQSGGNVTMAVDPAEVTVAGQAVLASLTAAFDANASVSATGQDAVLIIVFDIAAAAVAADGQAGAVLASITSIIDTSAAVAVEGQIVPLVQEIELVSAAAVSVAGQELLHSIVMDIDSGTVAIAGQIADLTVQIAVDNSSIVVTGEDVAFLVALLIEAGSVDITGQDVTLAALVPGATRRALYLRNSGRGGALATFWKGRTN